MKLLLLLVCLGLSGAVEAQVLAPKKVVPTKPVDLTEMLQNSANPRFIALDKPTPIYRQAADTLNRKQAFILIPNTRVYIKNWLSKGYIIYFNSEEYYLPYKSVVGLPVQIEI